MLERAGYEVAEARNGTTGLETAQQGFYDLVITDLNMPGMNGLALAAELRKLPRYEQTPIIVYSTECRAELKAQGKSVGVSAWVVKPCASPVFLSGVQRLLAKPR